MNFDMASQRELDLIRAAADGDLEGVRGLLSKGAKVDARHKNGMTALLAAALFGHVEIARALLVQGADAKIRYRNDATVLILAATQGQADVVRLLLERDAANVNERAKGGSTALIAAATNG